MEGKDWELALVFIIIFLIAAQAIFNIVGCLYFLKTNQAKPKFIKIFIFLNLAAFYTTCYWVIFFGFGLYFFIKERDSTRLAPNSNNI